MFCSQCGIQLQDAARFCSSCGTPIASSAPVSPAAAHGSPSPYNFQPVYSPPPVSPTSALISPAGLPQPAFDRLAAALFHALDQKVQPQRTGGMEVSKMIAYRTMGGATVPPYYGEQVLPTYAAIIPIDLIPNQPHSAPVVSWSGWHQYLLQKTLAEPDATFRHLQRACPALGVTIPLNRMDFPMGSFPNAEAKEGQFRTQIYGMAQRAMTMGAIGGTGFGRGSGMMGGGAGGAAAHSSSGTGKLAAKVGLNILNASMGGGGGAGFFPTS